MFELVEPLVVLPGDLKPEDIAILSLKTNVRSPRAVEAG